MLEERTGKSLVELAKRMKALIVTRGAGGSTIHVEGQRVDIPCVKADEVVDPTGCVVAYRAGLLYGIASDRDWRATGRLASLMGSLKIACRGGKNPAFDRETIAKL